MLVFTFLQFVFHNVGFCCVMYITIMFVLLCEFYVSDDSPCYLKVLPHC